MSKFLLSHDDMDGYGCNITALQIDPQCRILNVGYNSVDDKLQYMANELLQSDVEEVFITDLNFNELQTIELYKIVKHNPTIKFVYIDHHPYESERQHKIFEKAKELGNFEFVHSEKKCATYIFHKYAVKKGYIQETPETEKLASIINAFDTWQKEDPLFKAGLALNDVFYIWTKERFMYEITKEHKINDVMKAEMKLVTRKKNEFLSRLQEQGFIVGSGNTLLFLSDNYISHMTIDYPGYMYYINGRSYGNISVRISDEVPNAKEVKNAIVQSLETKPYVVSAGGHDHALGVTLDRDQKEKMLQAVQDVVAVIQTFN